MWLPSPIYEALPTAYVVVGVLLLGGVSYVGFDGSRSLLYAGLGVVCILTGIMLGRRRKQTRIDKS